MAIAKKCDVCGKLYEHESEKITPINGFGCCYSDSKGHYLVYDTCPECTKAFLDLIKKLGEKNDES